jgi:hypothetical protein
VCGGKMELVQAVPDPDMVVVGYERHTLQCPECGEQEHRLVFKGAQPPPEVSQPAPSVELSPPPSEIASPPAPSAGEGVSQGSPVGSPVASSGGSPIGAWARAIKKLHDQQDELRERAKSAQVAKEAARFTQDWAVGFQARSSEPASSRPSSPAHIARRMRTSKLIFDRPSGPASTSRKWARVVAKLDSKAVGRVGSVARPPGPQDDFDLMWEGIELSAPPPMPPETLEQPQSTSLVPVADENAGLWARAISMLRGTGPRNGEA